MNNFGENIYIPVLNNVLKKKYLCHNCFKTFGHQKYLNYHLKHECGRGLRFSCPYCDHKAKFSSGARAHVRRKHPGLEVHTIDLFKPAKGH